MTKRKSQAFTEAIVGVFMTVVILLLAYFTIVISGVDIIRGERLVTIRVAFDQVGGLKDHDNVMYRGTKVGVVDEVVVTPSNLVVSASIDRDVVMRSGYQISVCNLSMLGGNYMLLEEGEGKILDLQTTIFKGLTPTDWMKDVSEIAKNIRALTELKELRGIVTNVHEFSVKARSIADRAEAIVVRVERGEGTVGKLLSEDSTVYNDLQAAMGNARRISDRLSQDQTLEDLQAGIAAFRKAAEGLDCKETVAKANSLLTNLNVVAERLKNGEGTLGRLAADREMYDQVNALIKDVRQIIDNYRDTTPIATFSSLATGAL